MSNGSRIVEPIPWYYGTINTTYLVSTLFAENLSCRVDTGRHTPPILHCQSTDSWHPYHSRLFDSQMAIFSFHLDKKNFKFFCRSIFKNVFVKEQCHPASDLTLHVWISHGIFGWAIAFSILVVHRLAECMFSAHDTFARVRPLLSLIADAPLARVTGTSRRTQTLVTTGNVFTPAVLSTRVWCAFIRRSCNRFQVKTFEIILLKHILHTLSFLNTNHHLY